MKAEDGNVEAMRGRMSHSRISLVYIMLVQALVTEHPPFQSKICNSVHKISLVPALRSMNNHNYLQTTEDRRIKADIEGIRETG